MILVRAGPLIRAFLREIRIAELGYNSG